MADNNGAFPKLVMDIGPATQRAAPSVAAPLAQRVENRLREVLAWRPRSGDSRSFVAALNQAFTIRDVAGHTEWEWTPRSYAIQADMGAVTGAQASIYARARAALDQSRPLIEALYPLRSDADKEDVESIRALVLAQWHELVNELGRVGGPRLQRIDGLFDSLLGKDFDVEDNHEEVSGLLGVMRERFGFDEDRVNRIDEEQNWTNYLILVDHTIGLLRSWSAVKHYFDGTGADVFLGTQLVLLSRALDVITESVHSARMLMESVFLSEGEQQIVRLDSGLTIDDLLAWIESFCAQEAKQIIRDAGKDGVVALQPTLDTLLDLVHSAREQAEAGAQNPQPGFHTLRVRNALSELEQHIERAADLASQIRRGALRVTGVFPATIDLMERKPVLNITVDGTGFEPGATVKLFKPNGQGTNVTVKEVTVVSETRLLMLIDDGTWNQLAPGEWSLTVVNPDDEESDPSGTLIVIDSIRKPGDFALSSVQPNHGRPGDRLHGVAIAGSGFVDGMVVTFGTGITLVETRLVSENHLEVDIDIDSRAAPGPRPVGLWQPRTRRNVTQENLFYVDEPKKRTPDPALIKLDPNHSGPGTHSITITSKTDVRLDASTRVFFEKDIGVESVTVHPTNDSSIIVSIFVHEGAEGPRDVVLFVDDEYIRLPDAFNIDKTTDRKRMFAVAAAQLINRSAENQRGRGVKARLTTFDVGNDLRASVKDGVDRVSFTFTATPHPDTDWSKAIQVRRTGEKNPLDLEARVVDNNTVQFTSTRNFAPGTYTVELDPQLIKAANSAPLAETVKELTFQILDQ